MNTDDSVSSQHIRRSSLIISISKQPLIRAIKEQIYVKKIKINFNENYKKKLRKINYISYSIQLINYIA